MTVQTAGISHLPHSYLPHSYLIVAAVAAAYGLTPAELRSRTTLRRISRPRQTAAWLIRHMTASTYAMIAWRLGWADHSTAFHAVRTTARRRERDAVFAGRLDALAALIRALDLYAFRRTGPADAFRVLKDLAGDFPHIGPLTRQTLAVMTARLLLPSDPRWAGRMAAILPPRRPPADAPRTGAEAPPAPPLLAYIAAHADTASNKAA